MIAFVCHVCRTSLSVEDSQAGQMVRCPTCRQTLRVTARPSEASIAASVAAAGNAFRPRPGVGKRYGFNCGYCSSRLEANEGMAAQEGQCPTCGNTITIPIIDRYGRLIDPKTRQIIKQDPHPVHAYAAAGDRAPQIIRGVEGRRSIRCARCNAVSPITANNCAACGMPFTMEGTTVDASGSNNGMAVASLVLGIISLATFCLPIPAVLSIIFGIIAYNRTTGLEGVGSGRGMAIAGIVLGSIGSLFTVFYFFHH
jgi:DNA-directed RNA polymerase subunit RPC12/RpoP